MTCGVPRLRAADEALRVGGSTAFRHPVRWLCWMKGYP